MATLVIAPAARAQADAASADVADSEDKGEIVVTGTFIRGVAPAGTETVTVTPQEIVEAGGVTTNDVLAKIPQISFFNRQSAAGNDGGVGQQQKVNQPSVHGLPTLIMLDGHRIAPAGGLGVGNAAPSVDPSVIPTGVLGGIELVPDGGSATYGSDAVGGVINMTTIRKFDGIKLDGTLGFADDYKSYRVNATAGKDWGSGSFYAAYSYNKTDVLLGSSRPWLVRNPLRTACAPTGTVANPAAGGLPAASFTFTGVDAAGKPVGFAPGAAGCNNYVNESVLPEQKMHAAFAGLSQDLSPSIHVDIRGFYSTRRTTSYNDFALLAELVTVPTTNPFRTPTPAQLITPTRAQQASFTLAPALGRSNNRAFNRLDTWGISGEVKADVGAGFQVRLLGNYSQSDIKASTNDGLDSALLASALARSDPATALNPYNVAATPGSIAVAQQIAARLTTSRGLTKQTQVRLVTDGTLFHIGTGDVKIAAGGELLKEDFDTATETANFAGVLTTPRQAITASRKVYSAFGEVEVPLVSPGDNGPVYELHLSAAARYDHYSDFGNTFNPRFGVSLMPVEWLTFRGTYGRSFVAPALQQLYSARTGNISTSTFVLPGGAADPDAGRNVVILGGGNVGLKPQKATTWSLGLDLKAPFADGLRASLTYYDVHFKDLLGNPPAIGSAATFFTPLYQDFWIKNPTLQQALDFAAGTPVSGGAFTSLDQLYGAGGAITGNSPAYIITNRASNLGVQKTSGIDFDISYKQAMSFGSLDFGVAGNYIIKNEQSVVAGGAFLDNLTTGTVIPRFTGSASIGANVHNFRFSTTLYHTSGFPIVNPALAFGQTRVDAYNTVDAFLSYTFKDEGVLADTVATLNVTNVFNVRPPLKRDSSTGYGTGSILGRMFQIGLSKKF